MNDRKIVLTAGFAMFSMFFGSGNLVFPLLIGTQTLSQFPIATLGLIITAVIVPFLGLIGMVLFQGDYQKYFSSLGKVPSFLLIFAMLALMGPFGVVPRCITVAFGGVSLVFPGLPFWVFSFIFCTAIILLIWQKNKIIEIIGLFLTPLKLGSILLLLACGLWLSNPAPESQIPETEAFLTGLFQGYQTMDLMAAFFFSSATYFYLKNNMQNKGDEKCLLRLSIIASCIGAALLSVAYIGFVSLGAKYSPYLQGVKPEEILITITGQALGAYAKPVLAFTLAIACLATAVILSTLFVDLLQIDIFKNKISRPQSISITSGITFGISLLGFATICKWLGTILELAYPALIALAIANILQSQLNWRQGRFSFWIVLLICSTIKGFRFIF
jgi:LIVCS family branched-chain amino acid:cation transporter